MRAKYEKTTVIIAISTTGWMSAHVTPSNACLYFALISRAAKFAISSRYFGSLHRSASRLACISFGRNLVFWAEEPIGSRIGHGKQAILVPKRSHYRSRSGQVRNAPTYRPAATTGVGLA